MRLSSLTRFGDRPVLVLIAILLAAMAFPSSRAAASPTRPACPAPTQSAASVQLLFYDRNANEIPASTVQRIMMGSDTSYPKKLGWANDALIDPVTMCDLLAYPLFTDGTGHLSFHLLSQAAAFEVNWPTTRGYSMMILDNGGPGFTSAGTVNFTYQAALDNKRKLDQALAARPDYVRSTAFQNAYDAAVADISTANGSSSESVKGQYGQLALDQLAIAYDLLLYEYGAFYAHAHLGTQTPWFGVTIDTISNYQANLNLARKITSPYGYVRIVMDPGTAFSNYAPVVDYAHSIGLKVLGQPIDSSYAKRFGGSKYLARIQEAVLAMPTVDAWEIGNEVNGSWLGADMGPRLEQAAVWVKANTAAKVVITFYWQIGTDAPQWSIFNWERANLTDTTVDNTDIFLMSAWIEDAPMGLAFDQIMQTLHNQFPSKQIGLGEFGYWGQGTSQRWWYGDNTTVTAGRRAVADQYYRAALGYSYSVSGVFWWYYAEDMPADSVLACKVSAARDAVTGTPTPCP